MVIVIHLTVLTKTLKMLNLNKNKSTHFYLHTHLRSYLFYRTSLSSRATTGARAGRRGVIDRPVTRLRKNVAYGYAFTPTP